VNDIAEMEVEKIDEVPAWEVIQMVEIHHIAEELACEGPTIFEEKSLALHHTRYNKEAKRL
jgi:hypothetical protein